MYDRKEVYKKHIQKKAEELNDLCKSLGLVSFMSFCIHDDGKSTEYKNFICGSASNGIRLTNDQMRGHVNVANDFMTVPKVNDFDTEDVLSDIDNISIEDLDVGDFNDE